MASRIDAYRHPLRFDSDGNPAYAVRAGHFHDEVDACDSDG